MTPTAAARQSSTPLSLQDRLKDPSLLRDLCYIDGAWVGTGETVVTNPVNDVAIAKVPNMGTKEATQAVEAAERAFPLWAKFTAKQRSNILRKWFELIIANREDLALILTTEQGKPLAEALGEVDIGAAYIEFFAEEARRVYGETIPTQRPDARLLAIKQPIGVCGAITPWNFPNSMITRKVSPALAAGCTVVLKPANETPLSALALALAELAERAGIPKGVLNIVTGDASAIGLVLCEHPAVRFVGFTGSTAVGKILYRQASVGVKRLGLELGGNAPFVVFDDADIDAAVDGAMVSKYRNMGQTCVCANRIYAQDGIYDAFVEKLAKKVAAMKIGDGTEAGITQGPLINEKAVEKVERHIADAVKGGAKIVTGGKRHALGGTFFEPTVLSNVSRNALVSQEETFGPLAPVFRFKDEADVIAMCNASPFGLASYFYSRDLGRVWRVAEALESGMVGVNTGLITTEVAPFGGVKESGLGREGSHHGMEEYVGIKYIMMSGI
jgi:succinate-semialdehyde dehydrogenase/glutarate-semialdehyde dehydrogenase